MPTVSSYPIIKILVFMVCMLGYVQAQEIDWKNSNFQRKQIIAQDSIFLDSLVVIPEKFKIYDGQTVVNDSLFTINYKTGYLNLSKRLQNKSLTITYYTYPNLNQNNFSRDTALILEPNQKERFYTIEKKKNKKDLFEGINSRGSLVRGISFGNNQGAAVQSSLDLQLNGKLSEEVFINAAISDNNVPIETDGFTQGLQEFDQVFVEIYNKNSKIRAGNLDLFQNNDFFGNFTEKVTGVQLSTQIKGEKQETNIMAAGSISRGEFAINRFNGQEGNQGPYRLAGNSNELFIIIISGSERVFIDGIPLQRGEDQDYTINYNTGEITFTSNRLITANSRIIVEYLYADRNYSRFLFYAGAETKNDRFRVAGHFYSNGDSRGSPINQNLNDQNIEILRNAGDNTTQMLTSSAQAASFDENKIQYKTVTQNGVTFFEFTNNAEDQVFDVTFSFVGANQGNYVQSNLDTNGRIFSYVPPINGVPQGDFEPIQQLVAPERLQLYTLNAAYQFKKNGEVGMDWAMSNQNLNLFSDLDNEDNIGFASRFFVNRQLKSKNWMVEPKLEYSFINKNFQSIQRIRYEEFARNFNLQAEFDSVNQHYLQTGLTAKYKENLNFNYSLDYLDNQNLYQGFRHQVATEYKSKKNLVRANASLLNTKGPEADSKFNQIYALAKRNLYKSLYVGGEWLSEDNQIQNNQNQEFTNNSFRWYEFRALAGVGDSAKIFSQLTVYTRKDDSARLGNLTNLSKANGLILNSRFIQKKNHRLSLNGHYRRIDYNSNTIEDEDFVTGNLSWFKSFFNNGLNLNTFYELESGREAQREFQYVLVQDGLGIYKWTDYNNDGIEQLDEFEIAEFQDQASYIRVFTNTVNFLNTSRNLLTFSTNIQPHKIFDPKSKFLNRWLLQFSLQKGYSVLKTTQDIAWNPFANPNEALAKNETFRANLNFNKSNQYKWGVAYNYTNQRNRTFVFTGGEERNLLSHLLQIKYKPKEDVFVFLDAEQSTNASDSDLFAARRFSIENWRLNPKITYKFGNAVNATAQYMLQNKQNTMGMEQLKQSNWIAEFQWNQREKSSLLANFSYVNNQFTGNENSVVGNQMMEGLRAGNNFVWQLSFQRQLTAYLNLNLNYNGRKNENTEAIHSGSVQMQIRF